MLLNNKLLYKFIIVFLLLNSSLFSKELKKVSLQLQWKYQYQFAGYIVAKEKGFYKEIGLDVELKEWENAINPVDEVLKQDSNYAIARPASMIDIANGKKIVYLAAIFQSSPLILLTDKSSGIKTVKDFKNKNMMSSGDMNADTSFLSMMFSQGISIKDMKIQEPSFNPADLLNGKTDLMASYISNEPFVLKELGGDPVVFNPKDYGFDFYSDLLITSYEYAKNNSSEVKSFKNATLKGWEYAFENIDEIVDLIYKKYNTQNKSKEALKFEAKSLKSLAYYQTKNIGDLEALKLEKIYDVYKLLGLAKETINFNQIIFNPYSLELMLNENEKEYLKNKKSITMCIDPDWMPFERFNEKGEYEGMTSEYYKLFSSFLNTKFEVIRSKTWSQSLELAKNKECDILSLAMETPQRSKYLNFTTPYLKIPLVVTTRMDVPFVNDIKDLIGKKVAMPKGYAFAELLKNKYPKLQIIEVENIKQGLESVRKEKVFAYVGTLASVGYQLQNNYSGELKITGKIEQNWELGIGVRNDDHLLLNILQKAVNNVSTDNRQRILNKWISIKYEKGIDYSLIWKIIIGFLVVNFIFLFYYFRLKNLKNKLLEQKDEFETIFNNSKDGIAIVDLESNFLNCNEEYLKITGFTKDELVKKSCINLTDEKDRTRTENIIHEIINMGYVKNFEKTCTVKDNKRIIVNMSLSLMPDKKRILISTKDVTALKQLESQTKLASMGEMIGNIAHQWRQPLSVISTAATGMKLKKEMDMLNDKEFYSSCDYINTNVQYLSQTIDDFKNFIKGDTKPVDFNLSKDIESFTKLIQSSVKKYEIKIISDLDQSIFINGYPNELIQCFLNIFNNSKDAFLQNKIPENERYIFIDVKKDNNHLILSFKDTAGGIPENIINKVFDPYFTTKHQTQGTGLGLHMTYNLIRNSMKGNIEVTNEYFTYENKNYKGANFILSLPLNYQKS